jgi:hypothetical protein
MRDLQVMEVERQPKASVQSALKAVRARAPRGHKPVADCVQSSGNAESVACRVLFRRLPELLTRLVSTSSEPGQVTVVFRLGYFDMAGISQARKEFFQETRTGLRIMVEVPDAQRGAKGSGHKKTLQVKLSEANLKHLSRGAAPSVRTERLVQVAKTEAAAGLVEHRCAPESPVLRNLSQVVKFEQGRKLELGADRWLQVSVKEKQSNQRETAPNWLRRREQLRPREIRQLGPKATQNAHSAERQPHCLCPGCGREMISTLLFCPECTMRAARYLRVSTPIAVGQRSQSLVYLLSQAVSQR